MVELFGNGLTGKAIEIFKSLIKKKSEVQQSAPKGVEISIQTNFSDEVTQV